MADPALQRADATTKVLVVDDDPLLAELFGRWVGEKWISETVEGGAAALEAVDEATDVVLLDRRMPDVPGEEVLDSIRTRGLSAQVAFVSGVEPDVDVLDLPFDDYLRKPVEKDALHETIEGLLLRRTYHPTIQASLVCATKLELLESVTSTTALRVDDRYRALEARDRQLRAAVNAPLGRRADLVVGFGDAGPGGTEPSRRSSLGHWSVISHRRMSP